MKKSLTIKGLRIIRDDQEVVSGADLVLPAGDVHALMGPNGSGKSSLANAVMGHPKYELKGGSIRLDGEDITTITADKKARAGLFLSMQYPPEVPGVTISEFLRASLSAVRGKEVGVMEFRPILEEKMELLAIDPSFASRGLNEGFSGGEKKRVEILQLLVLEPKYAILDETDSGLDVDALMVVAEGIEAAHTAGTGILVITHYARILDHLKPDKVHVMSQGKVVRTGGPELAHEIEESGYGFLENTQEDKGIGD